VVKQLEGQIQPLLENAIIAQKILADTYLTNAELIVKAEVTKNAST
jgi:hypothetical protein